MTEALTRHAPGTPCWVSLMVHNLATSQDFYRELFGWEFHAGPQQLGPYCRALLNGREVAGLGEIHHAGRQLPIAWLPYVATDGADETCALIHDCCGTVGVGPLDAEDAGRLAIAADPAGASFGIWQAAKHIGAKISGVPGAPVWNELVTYESSAVGKFYSAVFGYELEPIVSTDIDYLMLHLHGRPVAGIHGVGNSVPRDRGPHWVTYFAVSDVDAASHQVTELGGHVVREPRESPYGRLTHVVDPEGALFAMIQMSEELGNRGYAAG
ncbi:VOC family protein [Streptomyces gobiensis]|uniref:VOC family protein n=1 Tax=Streptomyces gobiensis TaxID=2875706 RepID=UPI001E2FB611|nr:VOC family protein [Streptomyces gobiensis]UGY94074.1 VOC family protein [Streptomyces gobiensis]